MPTPPIDTPAEAMDIVIPYHVFQSFLAIYLLALLLLMAITLYNTHTGLRGDPKR
jgi:hypothetical protein